MPIDPTTDPDFMAASPSDQLHYLAATDKDFAGANPVDQLSYLSHITGGGPVGSAGKIPQPQMDTAGFGTATGMASGSKVPRSIQQAPDTVGMAIAGMAGLGAVSPAIEPMAGAAVKFAANHPIASMGMLEAAKALPGTAGQIAAKIPSWLPLLAGGKPSEGPPLSSSRAEGQMAEDLPIPAGKVPMPGPRPNGPYSGPNTPQFMEPAQSGNIAKHGYVPGSQTMITEFNNGKVYQASGVPKEVYDNFRNAESQGSFYAQNIKGRYNTRYRGSVSPTSNK